VGEVGLGVVASDASLELENFGDGVVELSTLGVPVADDVQRVWVRRESVVGSLELGVERIRDFT
jgi:hypothetical protein